MTNKFVLAFLISVLSLSAPVFLREQSALANSASVTNNRPSEPKERTAPSSLTGNTLGKSGVLTLNFLRDTGLSLQQIKQQAINIYLEVTRRDFQPGDKSVLVYPKSISDKALLKDHSYLPPRSEWLYYYVGTMEPIIHLFADDVSDTKNGVTRIFVPKAVKAQMAPLWQEWSNDIQSLNQHLSEIYQLANEDKVDNIAIGKHAVAMFKIGNKLESTRLKAVANIRRSDRCGTQSETVGIQ